MAQIFRPKIREQELIQMKSQLATTVKMVGAR